MTFTVTRVRKEFVYTPQAHEHIDGVCTTENLYYTRKQVVDSMAAGNAWFAQGGGSVARIKPMTSCPVTRCPATPYITTAPDHTTANNLDNLPRC
jgi:Protein of unknown function (DUF3892)